MQSEAQLLFVLFLQLFLLQICDVNGIQITDLRVPPEVQSGALNGVILDCEYTLRPADITPDSGLVVKWFFNNGPAPVYQWIPGQKPQDLGVLRGRLDLEYVASKQNASRHRALHIIYPSIELTGEYKCAISTFHEEDFMIKKMIVYSPEKLFEINQHKAEEVGINITCLVQGVYPEPKMAMFKGIDIKNMRAILDARVSLTAQTTTPNEFDIAASSVLSPADLSGPILVVCQLWIPNTTYAKNKTLHYYPGRALAWTDSRGGTFVWSYTTAGFVFLFLAIT